MMVDRWSLSVIVLHGQLVIAVELVENRPSVHDKHDDDYGSTPGGGERYFPSWYTVTKEDGGSSPPPLLAV